MSRHNFIYCFSIGVDCIPNSEEDIKKGGPKYLGYDFVVPYRDAKKASLLIEKKLKTLCVPIHGITLSDRFLFKKNDACSIDKIIQVIDDDPDYLNMLLKRSNSYTKTKTR